MTSNRHTCGCNNERVKALEKRVNELSETLAHYLAHKPTVFWSWEEVCSYTRRPKRTLQRYVKQQGFPVSRIGKFVISTSSLIDAWFVARKQQQRLRKNEPTYMGQYWRTHPRNEVSASPSARKWHQ